MVALAIIGFSYKRETYLFVEVLASGDTDELSGGFDFVGSAGVVDELLLHGGVVLEVGWFLHAANKGLGARCITGLAIGFTVYILRLDTWDIASVTYTIFRMSFLTYLEFIFLGPLIIARLRSRQRRRFICAQCSRG
jgi:hypothetical protein